MHAFHSDKNMGALLIGTDRASASTVAVVYIYISILVFIAVQLLTLRWAENLMCT